MVGQPSDRHGAGRQNSRFLAETRYRTDPANEGVAGLRAEEESLTTRGG